MNIEGMVDGQKAGLCHYSKSYAMVGYASPAKTGIWNFRPIKRNHRSCDKGKQGVD